MAKLKFAFQSEYYKTHRRQWRDYVFGYFHIAAGLAASMAPITNTLMDVPAIKNLIAKVLGITPHRPFPRFASRRAKLLTTETRRHAGKIILLPDAFARYIEPETEQAALDILSACGLEIHVLPILGAGAAFLSKGFVDQARLHAGRVLDLWNQIDPAGEVPVVGLEPPEIYTLKHDYVDLHPARETEIKARIDKVWLLDEFLLRSPEFDALRVANRERLHVSREAMKKVSFHPHCHQRAQGPASDGLPSGTNATLELLGSCGYEVELVDSGCCGMAGTFGYEAEHYDLSMKVAELKLFPGLRQLRLGNSQFVDPESSIGSPISEIVSSGAACRMQIKQGTGVEALHPILLVAKQLREWNAYGKS